MRIGLDMMGGDYAPTEAVKGLFLYLEEAPADAVVFAIGDSEVLSEAGLPENRVRIVNAPQVIEMHEHPTRALKEKPNSSISVGFHLLKEEQIDAFISAGNTGAMLVGTHFSIKPLKGIQRPAIGAVFPRINGKSGVLCDVGLNADCKPEQLEQFALLGSILAEEIMGIENPKVGLLNIGEEEGKGNILSQETYQLLKKNTAINFTGNIEGRDVFTDKADVMVCDGFTGNIVLKMGEQLYEIAKTRNINDEFFNRCNFETYGGTPILGVSKPVIIGHGISHQLSFKNMLLLAQKMIERDVMTKMQQALHG
ncbi:MAG: phosphate acyltransferase PlsX [Dinghuibacter sp.]|nr:phosphate acyltransferase PlsX [Dinghuibacter sp.]